MSLETQVSLPTESVRVKYVPTVVSQVDIRAAISKAGFEPLGSRGGERRCRGHGQER